MWIRERRDVWRGGGGVGIVSSQSASLQLPVAVCATKARFYMNNALNVWSNVYPLQKFSYHGIYTACYHGNL